MFEVEGSFQVVNSLARFQEFLRRQVYSRGRFEELKVVFDWVRCAAGGASNKAVTKGACRLIGVLHDIRDLAFAFRAEPVGCLQSIFRIERWLLARW